jgi:tetraspanin-18
MWDNTMINMKCCGVDSYVGFRESKKWTQGNIKTIPDACRVLEGDVAKLQPEDRYCPNNPPDTNSYWKNGCYSAVERIKEEETIVIGIRVGLVLIKLLCIISAFCLCRSIRVRQKKCRLGYEEERP